MHTKKKGKKDLFNNNEKTGKRERVKKEEDYNKDLEVKLADI